MGCECIPFAHPLHVVHKKEIVALRASFGLWWAFLRGFRGVWSSLECLMTRSALEMDDSGCFPRTHTRSLVTKKTKHTWFSRANQSRCVGQVGYFDNNRVEWQREAFILKVSLSFWILPLTWALFLFSMMARATKWAENSHIYASLRHKWELLDPEKVSPVLPVHKKANIETFETP